MEVQGAILAGWGNITELLSMFLTAMHKDQSRMGLALLIISQTQQGVSGWSLNLLRHGYGQRRRSRWDEAVTAHLKQYRKGKDSLWGHQKEKEALHTYIYIYIFFFFFLTQTHSRNVIFYKKSCYCNPPFRYIYIKSPPGFVTSVKVFRAD